MSGIEFVGNLVKLLRDVSPDAWMYDEEDNPFELSPSSLSPSEKEERCANCGGSGEHLVKRHYGRERVMEQCKRCQGTGIEIEK